MFVRIKKIQNKEYAYLVANEWTTSGSRQRVKQYLGKVHKPEKKQERKLSIDSMKDFGQLLNDAIKWELENHGFVHNNNGVLMKDGVLVHLNEGKIMSKNKNSVLALNEGFLCEHTMRELTSFKASTSQEAQSELHSQGHHERETSIRLATKIVEAGLKLPEEAFVQLFEKVFKKE